MTTEFAFRNTLTNNLYTVPRQNLEYVGFWPRLGAALIDVLLQLVITLPLTYVIYGRVSSPTGQMFMGFGDVMVNLVLPAVLVIGLWLHFGATPGKMAMSAKIVDADTGGPLTTTQSVIRYVGYFVSLIPFGVGYLWIAFDRKKQGWHDMMANSVVVRPSGSEPVRFGERKDWKGDRIEPR
ncbi:RDD family protein [Polaromonas sp.]|uniref:RDD family protein n=1 Tax=Polaromonas sp. TaxID=1869339 RepID=UPI003BA964B2